MKIKLDDLDKIKQRVQKMTSLREGAGKAKITVHMGTCGIAAGSRDIMTAIMDEISSSKADDVITTTSGCAGLCAREPMATVEILNSPPVKYVDLTDEKMREIFKEHVLGGTPVEKYALVVGSETTY